MYSGAWLGDWPLGDLAWYPLQFLRLRTRATHSSGGLAASGLHLGGPGWGAGRSETMLRTRGMLLTWSVEQPAIAGGWPLQVSVLEGIHYCSSTRSAKASALRPPLSPSWILQVAESGPSMRITLLNIETWQASHWGCGGALRSSRPVGALVCICCGFPMCSAGCLRPYVKDSDDARSIPRLWCARI